MKNLYYVIFLAVLILSGCSNRSSNTSSETPITQTDNDTVYANGNYSDIFNHTVGIMELTDLGWAIYQGNKDEVIALIEKGANQDRCLTDEIFEYDALYASIIFEKKDLIEYFIKEQKRDVNRIYGENCITPLVLVCGYMDDNLAYEIAKLLIEAGANVDGGGDCGFDYIFYPILEAADQENIALIKLLIENDADVNVVDKQGRTAVGITQDKINVEYNGIEELLIGALKSEILINDEHWYGEYSHTVVFEPMDLMTPMIQYTLSINEKQCLFSAMGYKTNFMYLCKVIQEENTRVEIIVEKHIKGDSSYGVGTTVATLITDNDSYYLMSLLIPDEGWEYNNNYKYAVEKN